MIFYIIFCAFLYAIKGGQHGKVRSWIASRIPEKFYARKIVDAAIDGKPLSAFFFGLIMPGFWLPALAWLAAVAPTIGPQIGAVGGVMGNWRDEGRKWGWKQGLMRGVWTGAILALAFDNTLLIIAGATFPICSFIGVSIEQIRTNTKAPSWWIYEWIYGGVLGVAVAYSL